MRRPSTAPAPEKKAVLRQVLNNYASAFHNFDGQRVLPYYHEPLILIGSAGVSVIATHADAQAWLNTFWERLRLRGFIRASKFSPLQFKQVSSSAAVASVQFVRYAGGGRELERIGTTYVLHKTDAGWKHRLPVIWEWCHFPSSSRPSSS